MSARESAAKEKKGQRYSGVELVRVSQHFLAAEPAHVAPAARGCAQFSASPSAVTTHCWSRSLTAGDSVQAGDGVVVVGAAASWATSRGKGAVGEGPVHELRTDGDTCTACRCPLLLLLLLLGMAQSWSGVALPLDSPRTRNDEVVVLDAC
jgi:hypothetical protein